MSNKHTVSHHIRVAEIRVFISENPGKTTKEIAEHFDYTVWHTVKLLQKAGAVCVDSTKPRRGVVNRWMLPGEARDLGPAPGPPAKVPKGELNDDAEVLDRIWDLLRDNGIPEVGTLDQQVAVAIDRANR